jgi:hypothetical protein
MLLMFKLSGESERAERFAVCPPPAFGRLLLYLREALSPLALANIVSRQLFRSFIFLFAAGGGHERRWARCDCCGLSHKN